MATAHGKLSFGGRNKGSQIIFNPLPFSPRPASGPIRTPAGA